MDAFIEESINSPLLEDYLRGSDAARTTPSSSYLISTESSSGDSKHSLETRTSCRACTTRSTLVCHGSRDAVHRGRRFTFNSEGEAELALRIYGPGILHKSHVIGTGVALSLNGVASRGVDGPYSCFWGRRDETKGVEFVIDAFSQYRDRASSSYSLVLAGPGTKSYHDPKRGIIDLGFVDEGTKRGSDSQGACFGTTEPK